MIRNKKVEYNKIKNYPKRGVNFIDLTPSLTNAKVFFDVCEELSCEYTNIESYKYMSEGTSTFDYIIVPESRGFIWGAAVARDNTVGIITARKKGKLPKSEVGYSIKYNTEYSTEELEIPKVDLKGRDCIFIDDIYATGGTYRACKEMVEKAGGHLNYGLVVADIGIDDNNEITSLLRGKEL